MVPSWSTDGFPACNFCYKPNRENYDICLSNANGTVIIHLTENYPVSEAIAWFPSTLNFFYLP